MGANSESTIGAEIGYVFRDKALLVNALTHSSYANEHRLPASACNERLEYLGDAVLELTVSDHIFTNYPELSEGEMTKLRASVVCEPMLAKAAREIRLGGAIKMGRGEDNSSGRERDSILSDTFEACIGAIYKDGGFEASKKFILSCIGDEIKRMRTRFNLSDAKTYLQECIQSQSKDPLQYVVTSESGPDHDKTFVVSVMHEGGVIGEGSGKSKKEAEQAAALDAINKLGFARIK